MSGQQTQSNNNTGHKMGGCDNVISFADFAARMEKKGDIFSRRTPLGMMAAAQENSVIYIGDLR